MTTPADHGLRAVQPTHIVTLEKNGNCRSWYHEEGGYSFVSDASSMEFGPEQAEQVRGLIQWALENGWRVKL